MNISNYNIVDRSESGVDFWAGGWSYTQKMIFETRLLDSTILPWQKAEKGAKSNPPRIPPNLSGEWCRMTPLYEGNRIFPRAASDYGSEG